MVQAIALRQEANSHWLVAGLNSRLKGFRFCSCHCRCKVEELACVSQRSVTARDAPGTADVRPSPSVCLRLGPTHELGRRDEVHRPSTVRCICVCKGCAHGLLPQGRLADKESSSGACVVTALPRLICPESRLRVQSLSQCEPGCVTVRAFYPSPCRPRRFLGPAADGALLY